jgi:hypothetical protein
VSRRQELDELVRAFGRHIHEVWANPNRIGCPEQSTLIALANQSTCFEGVASALEHIGNCAPCLEALAELRSQEKQSRQHFQ